MMKRFRYLVLIGIVTLSLMLIASPQLVRAQEFGNNQVKSILLDTFYGVLVGALVGAAISAPQDDPDWQQNVGSGAAIGAVAGLIFGLVKEGKPLVTESKAVLDVEGSQAQLNIPTIQPKLKADDKDQPQINYQVDLLCYHF
jgi:hypothetical protein